MYPLERLQTLASEVQAAGGITADDMQSVELPAPGFEPCISAAARPWLLTSES